MVISRIARGIRTQGCQCEHPPVKSEPVKLLSERVYNTGFSFRLIYENNVDLPEHLPASIVRDDVAAKVITV